MYKRCHFPSVRLLVIASFTLFPSLSSLTMSPATNQNSGISTSRAICQMVLCLARNWIKNFMFVLSQHHQMRLHWKSCRVFAKLLSTLFLFSMTVAHVLVSRKAFDEPIASWDCKLKEEVLLRPFGLFFAGDNPMQAELSSSAGLNCNYFCRTCKVGGTRKHKQSDVGFSQILAVGRHCTPHYLGSHTA